MFIIGDILITTANVLHMVLGFYQWIILASVLISWFQPRPNNDIVRTLLIVVHRMTEPLFFQVRKRMPRALLSTGMDFSSMIVWISIFSIDMLSYRILMNIGVRLSMGSLQQGASDLLPQM